MTDVYLLSLAARRGAALASFDAGIRQLEPEIGEALEIVPTT